MWGAINYANRGSFNKRGRNGNLKDGPPQEADVVVG